MKAAVYEKFQGPISVQQVEDPKPKDHGVLEMIKTGKMQPEKLIEKTISLQDVTTALPGMTDFDNNGIWVITSF